MRHEKKDEDTPGSRAGRGCGRRRRAVLALMTATALIGAVTLPSPAWAQAPDGGNAAAAAFDIPPQPLSQALVQFSRITGVQLFFNANLVRGISSPGARGAFSRTEALRRLLSGSGLVYQFTNASTVTIARASTGEAAPDGALMLDPIDVVASRGSSGFQGTPDRVYETPGSVSVVTQEAIRSAAPRHAGNLFSGVAGTYTADNPQNPGVNVNIRGLQDQTRVNMMIDGARQNFQRAGHASTGNAYIDPALIREVEVEKSVSSGVGGAASLGGSVDFRTIRADDVIRPGQRFGSEIDATTGTNAYTFQGSASAAARYSDTLSVLAAVSRKKLGEYEIGKNGSVLNASGVAQDAPVFTGLDAWSGLVKLEGRPTDNTTMDVSWLGYRSNFSAGTDEFSDTDKAVNQTLVGNFGWKPDTPLIDLRAKLWYNQLQYDQFRPARDTYGAFDLGYTLGTVGGSVDNTSRFDLRFGALKLNYGFEAFRDRTGSASAGTDATDDPEDLWFSGPNPSGRRAVASGFGTATFDIGRWLSFSGGLRYDHYELTGNARVFAGKEVQTRTVTVCIPHPITGAPCWRTRQDTVTTTHDRYASVGVESGGGRLVPTAGVTVTPVAGLQLFAKYSEGYRPPTIMEVAFGGAHIGNIGYFGPNPGLKPEQSQTFEVGANVKRDDLLRPADTFRFKAVWFDRRVEDYVGLGTVTLTAIARLGPQTYQGYVNFDGTTQMRGVEVEGAYDIGSAYLGASFTYIDADFPFDSATATSSGPLLLFVPPKSKVTVDAGVRAFDKALTLGGRVTHVGKSEYEGLTASQYELSDYTVFDLYGSYAFNDRTKLRFAVNNLTDLAYVPALGGPTLPAPGRTATMSLNVKF